MIEPYPSWTWVDYPAVYHNGGDNVAFADGHVEHWKYVDRRTIAFSDSYTDSNFGYTQPGNEDLRRYQKVYNPQRDNASRKNTSFGSRNTQ